jgi:hypothetical protein
MTDVQKVCVESPDKHMDTVETLAAPKNNNQCNEIKTPFSSHTPQTSRDTRNECLEKANIPANPTAAMTQRKKARISPGLLHSAIQKN